ncbi:hypothetical protein [Parapedobacter tibetensis]|uniref:hypothetical protein n=1 Tax=Parapedobacter tibetensis TaxID=2972951 RepID=UPI00214D2FFA|nr:hypothetical protein [Parapedobacter tibetensis]
MAQHHVAIPQIINYNSGQFKGGLQNWDIAQDTQGIMYFGNNEGLLTFNRRYWNIHPLPNATVVRSVAIDRQNRVYVGGQDELGYFEADTKGYASTTQHGISDTDKDSFMNLLKK